ncbi:AraC family transcriptional regulator [uncultured Tistrella sp.]|uniref:helix-turn-helix transcriptional regulator n=1 Tax=Tistrella mobilis TaxID=171437 RepID=UPI000C091F8A|nr:AraC family transcriptional regulator [uncultured Tistrella sp.]MAM76875.1 AraC family transcriptional regulator [Tistrella sp.]
MNGPEGLIQSPEDITAPGALRIDRLSAFLRRFPLRVTALREAAALDGPPAQFALAGDAAAPLALFDAVDVRPALADRPPLLLAGIAFGGAGNPLLAALDRTILLPAGHDPRLAAILGALVAEWQDPHCGAAGMIERLVEAAVIRLLRSAVARGADGPGLLAGLSHPRLHRTLAALHEAPERPWRVEDMADIAGMSRSAFMAAFRAALGTSPAAWLTAWRLAEARRHLDAGHTVKEAARLVGFGSAEALAHAHRRRMGQAAPPLSRRPG